MLKVIVIVGATCTSKTTLAQKIALDFNAEIINADSFQVYKELNIGTNKPSLNDIKKYHFHLVNQISIYDAWDIKIFQDKALKIISDLYKKKKNIIICGGSNLYINALIKGYHLTKTLGRNEINFFDNWNYHDIYEYVDKFDHDEAIKININNKKRIIRAAQIIYSLKQPKSTLDNQSNDYIYDCFLIETTLDRETLYNKINMRVEQMRENNWYEEVKQLFIKDKNIVNLQAFNAIGYKQILFSITNGIEPDWELIKKNTRNYAKKQLTWNNNKYNHINKFNLTNDDYNHLQIQIKDFLGNSYD